MAGKGGSIQDLIIRIDADTEIASRSLGELRQQVETQLTSIQGDITNLDSGFRKFGAGVRTVTGLLGAFGVALSVGALVPAARGAVDYAAGLALAAQELGVTVEQLQVLNRVARENGVATEDMRAVVGRFTQSLADAQAGTRNAVRAFQGIGITPAQLNGFRQGGDALREVAQRIVSIEEPSRRAQAAQALFGREGQRLIPILTAIATGYDGAARRAREMGLLTDEQAAKARDANDQLEALSETLRTKLAIAITNNIGPITGLTNALAGFIENLRTAIPLASTLAGISLGSRFGGLPGAIIGGGAGYIAGTQAMRDPASDARAAADMAEQQFRVRLRQNFPHIFTSSHVTQDQLNRARVQGGGRAWIALNMDEHARRAGNLRAEARRLARTPADTNIDQPPTTFDTADLRPPSGGGRGRRSRQRRPERTPESLRFSAYDDMIGMLSLDREGFLGDRGVARMREALSLTGSIGAQLDEIAATMGGIPPLEPLSHEDLERLEQFRTGFLRDISGGLADALVYGRNLGDVLVNSFQRAAAELASSAIFQLLSGGSFGGKGGIGGVGSFIGALFGGFRAEGGPMSPGKWYVTGERGPEIVVPKVPSVVIPNHAIGGGARPVVNNHYYLRGNLMTPEFWSRINAGDVAAAGAGAAGAQQALRRRASRRLP
ncbi:MAG: hypothetical protein KF780_12335 [Sphingomonas sp.]|nr:hypothetical protein [Sphingomonas sp.]